MIFKILTGLVTEVEANTNAHLQKGWKIIASGACLDNFDGRITLFQWVHLTKEGEEK